MTLGLWFSLDTLDYKKSLKIPKGLSETIHRRKIDKTMMAKTNGKAMIYKTLHKYCRSPHHNPLMWLHIYTYLVLEVAQRDDWPLKGVSSWLTVFLYSNIVYILYILYIILSMSSL